jgi:hypothetical protein
MPSLANRAQLPSRIAATCGRSIDLFQAPSQNFSTTVVFTRRGTSNRSNLHRLPPQSAPGRPLLNVHSLRNDGGRRRRGRRGQMRFGGRFAPAAATWVDRNDRPKLTCAAKWSLSRSEKCRERHPMPRLTSNPGNGSTSPLCLPNCWRAPHEKLGCPVLTFAARRRPCLPQ